MNKLACAFLVLSPVMMGCSGQKIIVVQGNPPEARSFTVIPVGYSDSEIEFAGAVEQGLVRAGLSLLERPPIKFLTSDKEFATGAALYGNNASVAASVKEPGKLVDMVAMYPDSKATHIVATYASSRRIRIIEKATGGVVSNIELHKCWGYSGSTGETGACDDILFSAIAYAKLASESIDEKQCPVVKRKVR